MIRLILNISLFLSYLLNLTFIITLKISFINLSIQTCNNIFVQIFAFMYFYIFLCINVLFKLAALCKCFSFFLRLY